jgi:tRNA-splicing ligase RtcB
LSSPQLPIQARHTIAIRAGLGELGIIPGSMGSKSYIARDKGNALSFESASHGAGGA